MTGNGAGWRSSAVMHAADLSRRQVDYWDRCHYLSPSVEAAHGTGTRRLYSTDDAVALAVAGVLLDAGVGLRRAIVLAREAAGAAAITAALSDVVTLTVDVDAVRAVVTDRLAAHTQATS